MIATLIVGATGRGKSTSAKKLLNKAINEKREIMIYDPNAEYTQFYKGEFLQRDKFLEKAVKLKNGFILFEEATIFFSNKGRSEELCDLLVRKRHTNNEVVLLFHSLRSIPVDILELVNYIVLYKTNDRVELVNKKFEGMDEILKPYEILINTPDDSLLNHHKNFIIEMNSPVHLNSQKFKTQKK